MKLPCITIGRVHSALIADLHKTIETRSHNRFGLLIDKRIGIHASLKLYTLPTLRAKWFPWELFDANEQEVFTRWRKVADRPSGLIATAYVEEYRRLTPKDSKDACFRIEDGDELYGLILTDIHKLATPIPITGQRGIWYYDI